MGIGLVFIGEVSGEIVFGFASTDLVAVSLFVDGVASTAPIAQTCLLHQIGVLLFACLLNANYLLVWDMHRLFF